MAANNIFILLIITGMFVLNNNGLETDHWGTQFICSFIYPMDYNATNIIAITARELTNVRVIFQETKAVVNLEIPAGETRHTWLSDVSIAYPLGIVLHSKAVSVEASAKVSVYAYSYSKPNKTSDGILVLPVASLGTKYLAVNLNIPYDAHNQIVIIAADNDTSVVLTYNSIFSQTCINNGVFSSWTFPATFTMQAYDVLNIYCVTNSSGVEITSSKPVAVITGSRRLKLHDSHYRSQVMEMLPPTTEFGTEFAFITPHGHTGGTLVRIISEFSWSTTILNNGYSNTPKEPTDINFFRGTYLCFTTTQPVLVVVFMTAPQNRHFPTDTGDAFMMVVPPVTKFSNHYVIPMDTIENYSPSVYHSGVDVIFQLPINGPVSPSMTLNTLCPKFVVNSSETSLSGTVEFSAKSQFMVLVYGFTFRDAFGFPGGMKLTDFSGIEECGSSPCMNNGWCIETAMSHKCHCPDTRYTGQYCDIDTINDCDFNPCVFGMCNDFSGFYTCNCFDGFTGYNCSTYIETTTEEPTTQEPITQEPTTHEPTTLEPTTQEPTTQEPTTQEPTTQEPTTEEPTTLEPTTQEPTTQEPTTQEPTTQEPTTQEPTTLEPTTLEPTTQEPTTLEPTTLEPTTLEPTTQEPTTQEPTTQEPTTQEPTTQEPTTLEPTTQEPTTQEPTTQEPTTQEPTTQEPTTQEPTTQEPTPQEPTTQEPTTQEPTTQEPTTQEPTTQEPTIQEPTTQNPTTQEPTTQEPTTQEPTTQEPTTQEPTTQEPTTQEQTTLEQTTQGQTTQEPTTQEPITQEQTTQEQTTKEQKTQEQTTQEQTTTVEATTQEQTTLEQTTQELTMLEQTTTTATSIISISNGLTTLSFTPTKIYVRRQFCNRELCMCKCPCIKKLNSSQVIENTIESINALKVEKGKLSKTVRKKISSENLTQSETNLGVTSVLLVTSVFCTIIFMDMSRVVSWVSTKITKRCHIIHVKPINKAASSEK